MKKTKKVLSFLLAIVMVFAMSFTTAFAAEAPESNMEQNAPATSGDEGIMPLVWNQFTADVPANSSVTLSGFSIPERYMAYEASANIMNGGTTSETYTVELQTYGNTISLVNLSANGNSHKVDWVDLSATNNSVGFHLSNHASVAITVHIIYYSWS